MFEGASAVLGIFVALGTILNTFLILKDRARLPIEELKGEVANLKEQVKELQRDKDKTNERIDDLESDRPYLLKSLRALLGNAISGNNMEETMRAKQELDEYLDTR